MFVRLAIFVYKLMSVIIQLKETFKNASLTAINVLLHQNAIKLSQVIIEVMVKFLVMKNVNLIVTHVHHKQFV